MDLGEPGGTFSSFPALAIDNSIIVEARREADQSAPRTDGCGEMTEADDQIAPATGTGSEAGREARERAKRGAIEGAGAHEREYTVFSIQYLRGG